MVYTTFIGSKFLFGKFAFITEVGCKLYNPLYKELYINQQISGETPMFKQCLSIRLGIECFVFAKSYSYNIISVGSFIKANE